MNAVLMLGAMIVGGWAAPDWNDTQPRLNENLLAVTDVQERGLTFLLRDLPPSPPPINVDRDIPPTPPTRPPLTTRERSTRVDNQQMRDPPTAIVADRVGNSNGARIGGVRTNPHRLQGQVPPPMVPVGGSGMVDPRVFIDYNLPPLSAEPAAHGAGR
jgi:hypothetical protein